MAFMAQFGGPAGVAPSAPDGPGKGLKKKSDAIQGFGIPSASTPARMPATTSVPAPTTASANGAETTTGKRARAAMTTEQVEAKISALAEQRGKNVEKRLRADQQTTLCDARAKAYAIDIDRYTKLLQTDRSAIGGGADESEDDGEDADTSRPRKRGKTLAHLTDDEIRAKIAHIVEQQDKNEAKRMREEYKCAYCDAKNKGIDIELGKFRRMLKEAKQ